MTKIPGWLMIASLAFTTGCQYYFPPQGTAGQGIGQILVASRFPEPLKTKIIPGDTESIEVRVTGEKIPEGSALFARLTRSQTTITFRNVPAGEKTVTAVAFDAEGINLARGTATATVIAGATVTVIVTLELIGEGGKFNLIIQYDPGKSVAGAPTAGR